MHAGCLTALSPASAALPSCAVDQNQPRRSARGGGFGALGLGSCDHLGLSRALTWGERSGCDLAAPGCFHRGSPLFPARSGALVVRGMPYCTPGIRPCMLAMVYHSYDAATTVWAFALSVLIVLAVGWYVRHRR